MDGGVGREGVVRVWGRARCVAARAAGKGARLSRFTHVLRGQALNVAVHGGLHHLAHFPPRAALHGVLLVHAAPGLGPHQLCGLLALVEHGRRLAAEQDRQLAGAGHEAAPSAGVDLGEEGGREKRERGGGVSGWQARGSARAKRAQGARARGALRGGHARRGSCAQGATHLHLAERAQVRFYNHRDAHTADVLPGERVVAPPRRRRRNRRHRQHQNFLHSRSHGSVSKRVMRKRPSAT